MVCRKLELMLMSRLVSRLVLMVILLYRRVWWIWIIVTEYKGSLIFQNDGSFFEGDYRQYITGEKTPKSYLNRALVKAIVNIKMIDTQGYGIHKMFVSQKERYLPMPDYDLSTAEIHMCNPT